MKEITVRVYSIERDGLPPKDGKRDPDDEYPGLHESLVGRIGFIWDGVVFMGWPLDAKGERWEASEDCVHGNFSGVTHWIEFPIAPWDMEKT